MRKKLFENRFSPLIMQNYGSVLKVSKRKEDIHRMNEPKNKISVRYYFSCFICAIFLVFLVCHFRQNLVIIFKGMEIF